MHPELPRPALTELTSVGAAGLRIAPTAQELCAAHAERVYRFAVMVSWGDAEADDLAQEALERAIRYLDTFDAARGSLEGWLWRIVLNVAADPGRRARRRELLRECLWRFRVPEAFEDPALVRIVTDEAVIAAIRTLRPRDRELIALRFGAGLAIADVARTQAMSTATAGVAVRRAMTRLRTSLAEGE